MTCLHANAISQPDGDQPSSNPILSSLLLQAVEHLRLQWRSLGLNGDPLLSAGQIKPRLESMSARSIHRMLGQIMVLVEGPALCKALAVVLQRHYISPEEGPALLSVVQELSPLFVSVPTMRRMPPAAVQGEPGSVFSRPIDTFDLSIRTYNALRRNGFHTLGDLVGVNETRLKEGRGIGDKSIEELRDMLQSHGIRLPFTVHDLEALASVEQQLASETAPQPEPVGDLLAQDSSNRRWCDQAAECIRRHAAITPALKLIQMLDNLCEAEPVALLRRREELHQLTLILVEIQACGTSLKVEGSSHAAEILQRRLLEHYASRFSGGSMVTDWLHKLSRAVHRPDALPMMLMHAAGVTLDRIGRLRHPALTREGVRVKFMSLLALSGCTITTIRGEVLAYEEHQRQERLRLWINTHGRLPYGTDPVLSDLDATEAARDEFLLELASASLQQRLETYATLKVQVPPAEWDLHYKVICQGGQHLGTGYWHTIEPLKQFLPRYAVAQGVPGQMGFQVEMPPAVRGAITRHGGQGPVARLLGLTYRGQLMGTAGCRSYWTHERLAELLEHAAQHHGLPTRAMPSQPQIRRFMTSGAMPEYTDKKVETVLLALKGYTSMTWQAVAAKFGRYCSP